MIRDGPAVAGQPCQQSANARTHAYSRLTSASRTKGQPREFVGEQRAFSAGLAKEYREGAGEAGWRKAGGRALRAGDAVLRGLSCAVFRLYRCTFLRHSGCSKDGMSGAAESSELYTPPAVQTNIKKAVARPCVFVSPVRPSAPATRIRQRPPSLVVARGTDGTHALPHGNVRL